MLILLAGPALADAWDNVMTNQYDAPIVWAEMPIAYEVNTANDLGLDPDGIVEAAVAAAGAWRAAEGTTASLAFVGTGEVSAPEHDNVNTIYFASPWDADSSLLALTTVWSESDGNAVGFDIRINAEDHVWTLDGAADADANDLQNTLAHELGHALGFGHLADSPSATMYPSAAAGETSKRDLDEADIALAVAIYPDGTVVPVEGEPFDPLAEAVCGTRQGLPLLVPSLLVLGALLARRPSETA